MREDLGENETGGLAERGRIKYDKENEIIRKRNLHMTFSERMGLKPVRNTIQVDSLDTETRNALWNVVGPFFDKVQYLKNTTVVQDIWTKLYHQASDTRPPGQRMSAHCVTDAGAFYQYFRSIVIQSSWNECLDLIDFLAKESYRRKWKSQTYDLRLGRSTVYIPSPSDYNAIFEEYLVGFRFIGDVLTPISNEIEIQGIEDAIQSPEASVRELLIKALKYLSDRNHPDYAKSIDCSISSVESQCGILLGRKHVSLGDALTKLESHGIQLHPALKGAFDKLYGYTSNADGIRHGGIRPAAADQDLAKFMLVACSAFVNYLIAKGGVFYGKHNSP